SATEDPALKDLYKTGTVARILKLLRMPDGTATAIIQGRRRFSLMEMLRETPYMEGRIELLEEAKLEDTLEFKALISTIKDKAKQIIQLSPNIPSEASAMLRNITNDSFLINFIASNLGISNVKKQNLLEIN